MVSDEKKYLIVNVWGGVGKMIAGMTVAVGIACSILFVSVVTMLDPGSVFSLETGVGAVAEVSPKIEYYLPYPGLLPDSPVYVLKAARDKISLWFTFSMEKKAEKELLFADKRIGAAAVLLDGGKTGLGVSVATKAEKYYCQSVNRISAESKKGRDVKSLLSKLSTAGLKHQEMLVNMKTKLSGQGADVVSTTWTETKVCTDLAKQTLMEAK